MNTLRGDKPNLNETVICHQIPKRCMDRESADRTGKSIDRFIESEMSISRGFMVSVQNVMGRKVRGGRKDAGEYDETGEWIIRFDLTED